MSIFSAYLPRDGARNVCQIFNCSPARSGPYYPEGFEGQDYNLPAHKPLQYSTGYFCDPSITPVGIFGALSKAILSFKLFFKYMHFYLFIGIQHWVFLQIFST